MIRSASAKMNFGRVWFQPKTNSGERQIDYLKTMRYDFSKGAPLLRIIIAVLCRFLERTSGSMPLTSEEWTALESSLEEFNDSSDARRSTIDGILRKHGSDVRNCLRNEITALHQKWHLPMEPRWFELILLVARTTQWETCAADLGLTFPDFPKMQACIRVDVMALLARISN